ncbi:carboxymuconolactone decarboxylase family protein [Xylophilus sp. GOD-11R]|uniref:carboxymuconolactone decarboxylase family protein n=1 Tax=Xylophilus sp. GOD-11R TaxID=3089814 RepID=UPI00298CF858|nr:carboxymuconolactone decarboxylase family protein [Xylophilus sp. GOD-11R]WPB55858.1 carboxymuconolactone decarboxylase family protein [Xylophilus sp. GOD-11R]
MNFLKTSAPALAAVAVLGACAHTPATTGTTGTISMSTLHAASPALEKYTEKTLLGDLWGRTDLIARDRSIVTLAALISRKDLGELAFHFNKALDNGVKPGELSEMLAHLAFYSGWGNATAAAGVLAPVFQARGIQASALPPATVDLLPIDQKSEDVRVASVSRNVGDSAPGLVKFTSEALFHDLWLRPGLAPRDRSLVTFSSLVATGQVAQLGYHLNRAMDNGLKQAEASEALAQLAFYAGWPNVFTAIPVVRETFAKRPA